MGKAAESEHACVWDHRALGKLIEEVSGGLGELRSAEAISRAGERRAVRQIDRLEAALAAHFELEEGDGGFFAEVLAAAPERGRRLDELRSAHGPLGEAMRALVGRAHGAGTSSAAWAGVARELDALLAHLQRHELAEDQLVAEALQRDLGGG